MHINSQVPAETPPAVDGEADTGPVPGLLRLHRRAVQASVDVVSRVTRDDLDRATPCSDWTLADLLTHMTTQHRGFAAAAAGRGGEPGAWQVRPLGDDPVADYTEAAEHVLTAFTVDAVTQCPFLLPEIDTQAIPGALAIRFHFIDYVVHGWDVARSLRIPFSLPTAVLRAALPIAEAVPDGASRRTPGAAFRPRLPLTGHVDGLDPMDRIVALLGRSPAWPD